MLVNIGIAIVVALALFLIYVASRPAAFVITRSSIIPAAPDKVFALVNDFHEWDSWSPWAKLDPQCKNTFDGARSGVGAKFAWDGNNQVGSGHMEITVSHPHESIKLALVFSRPMQATNETVFDFQPEGKGTRVTWTMSGTNGFMGKLFGIVMNCDKMVGGQFEEGLENMSRIVTSGS
jgi:hypothetical protein